MKKKSKKSKIAARILVFALIATLALPLNVFAAIPSATDKTSQDSYMKEIVEELGKNLDGEDMFDYLSYVYLGWRTTGGRWQNQVIDSFVMDQLTKSGYTDAGKGASSSNGKSANDKSSAIDDDYAWVTYFNDVTTLTWDPEYAKLDVTVEGDVEGKDALIKRINVENFAFNPTTDTYLDHYGVKSIDEMWSWITEKDANGNRVNVLNGKEAELNKRVHLAWNSCLTESAGTKPEDAKGVTGELVYVGTISKNTNTLGIPEEELAGKVLLSDSSLNSTFTYAQKVGAIAVASKGSLSNYSTPKNEDGTFVEPFQYSARYASGASLTKTDAQNKTGKPIVEWQLSNDQYSAMKDLLAAAAKAEQKVMVNNVAIGDVYAMNDNEYGSRGQAVSIAEIKGATKPDERILLCAHVQEPSSNDNATGVGTLLGMATKYKEMIDKGLIERPERTITFMWGDEMQMATLYMSSHSEEKAKLVGVLDLDMTGEDPSKTGGTMRIEKTPDPSANYNYTLDELYWENNPTFDESFKDADGAFVRLPDSHTLWGAGSTKGIFDKGFYLNDLYMYATQSVINYHDNEFQVDVCPYEGGSDHSRFLAQQIPALLTWHFTDYTYHTSVDTLNMSSAREMENVGITSLAAAIMMADATENNLAVSEEIAIETYKAAMKRFDTEAQNTINHQIFAKANGGDYEAALANEKEVLTAWYDWYVDAIDSPVWSLIGGKKFTSVSYRELTQSLKDNLKVKYEKAIEFAEKAIQETPTAVAPEVVPPVNFDDPEPVETPADKVTNLISSIGEVTLESEAAIVEATEAYNKLTDEEKAQVKNYSDLKIAKLELEQLKAQEAKELVAPEKPVATNDPATGKVKLTWNEVGGAEEYAIYVSTSKNGPFEKLSTVTGTSYIHKSAEAGVAYFYKVKALTSDKKINDSKFSPVISRTCDLAKPAITTKNAKNGQVVVSWKKVENAKGYAVYKSTSKTGKYTKAGTTSKLTYTTKILKPGNAYYFKVKAIAENTAANSAFSNTSMRTCDVAAPVISAKSAKKGQITVSWKKAVGAKKYVVYRATSKTGKYTKVGTTTKLTFKNTKLKAGKTYYYKVKALAANTNANSTYSSVVACKCHK